MEISLQPCFKNLRHKIFVLVQGQKFLYRIMQKSLLYRFYIAAEGRVYTKNDFAFCEIRSKTHLFSKIFRPFTYLLKILQALGSIQRCAKPKRLTQAEQNALLASIQKLKSLVFEVILFCVGKNFLAGKASHYPEATLVDYTRRTIYHFSWLLGFCKRASKFLIILA